MSTTDEREAYQGDAQDFRHKQSLRTDAPATHNASYVKRALRQQPGVCPECGGPLEAYPGIRPYCPNGRCGYEKAHHLPLPGTGQQPAHDVTDEKLIELAFLVGNLLTSPFAPERKAAGDLAVALRELLDLRTRYKATQSSLTAAQQREAELLEYARRVEDLFVALAGTISDAEEARARKSIAAERMVCFAGKNTVDNLPNGNLPSGDI